MSPRLFACTVRRDDVTPAQRAEMYGVFERYYSDVNRERFDTDLDKKHHVILLSCEQGIIRGFSTLQRIDTHVDGRPVHAVFSGDTVIERSHWGGSALQLAFASYMLRTRARHPARPLYWLLISKGYKTYLLMANNFREHWPRFERAIPEERRRVRDALAEAMFAGHYFPSEGLLRFPPGSGALRAGIADAHDALKRSHPRVAFFTQQNPRWADGEELVCLATVPWTLPLEYGAKLVKKRLLGVRLLPAPGSSSGPG